MGRSPALTSRKAVREEEEESVPSAAASRRAAERPIVAGIGISHPDRLVFPAARASKLDLARYYDAVAEWMLPDLIDRALTLVHCPKGIPSAGVRKGADCIFMKHAKAWGPSAIRRVRIQEKTKVGEYLIADSRAALVGLAQMNVLEIHTWNSRHRRLEQPDRVVIDLDPGTSVGWPEVVGAARLVRDALRAISLESFVKTTGGRGVHIVVPIAPDAAWGECLEFARLFARTLVTRQAAMFTDKFAKAGREDKILVDYLRNNRTNTSVAAYSTRANASATVSTPLAWSELSASKLPGRFTMSTVLRRLRTLGADPWRGYAGAGRRQRITAPLIRALEQL
jgi:bifunctional non-homologous end joining protein LigD